MSRGFVKEDDQEEIPLVPLRAHLPNDATNFVTQNGMDLLLVEKKELQNEKDNLAGENEKEIRISINHINSKLQVLQERIDSAKIIQLKNKKSAKVRFGATVTLKINDEKKLQEYQIVGVDEANISKRKISYLSPIAQLLLHKKAGEKAILKLTNGDRIFEIIDINF